MKNALSESELAVIASEIATCFPGIYGAYLFGSAAAAELRDDSDLDLAFLHPNELLPHDVLSFKGFISQKFRRDVDIVDLYRADTVTAAQVVFTGIAILNVNKFKVAEFETIAFSSYALLNEERAEILRDIELTGTIYGR